MKTTEPANLILIHGRKRSGKDTIAEHLVANHGFTPFRFAEPLKNMVRSLLRDAGIAEEEIERYIEGDLKEEPIDEVLGTSSRYIMKTLGVEWRDLISNRLFSFIAERKIAELIADGHKVVVTDFRFMHEYEEVKHLSPALWCVIRKDNGLAADGHSSERPLYETGEDKRSWMSKVVSLFRPQPPKEVVPFHAFFRNDGTLEELYRKVEEQMLHRGAKNEKVAINQAA